MNKKIIKIITSISLGGGLLTTLPLTTTSCSFSNNNPSKLNCDDGTIPGDITGDVNTQITPTLPLSGHIKTDIGEPVSNVTFTCKGLNEQTGLNINATTGVINGTLNKKPTSPNFKIKFTANVDGKQLEGYTDPFTITVNPTKLVCDDDTIPGDITGNLDSEISPTVSLLNHIKTDTEESVSGVTFACDSLPNGLSINQSTGVIFGIPTHIQESTSYIIKFSCTFKGTQLEGSTEINIETNGPQSIVCSEIEDQSVVVNKSFSLGVTDVKMVFDEGVQKTLSSSDIASYELVDDKGQSAASTLPQGLTFNTNNGSIYGTVTSLNYYAPTTYKIKIIGSQRIGSVIGYSNTFKLSMQNNPLPETVYNIENNVLKGFKEGIDLSQYEDICNIMQIPANVTSINDKAFYVNSTSTIPTFIKNLTFAENSICSSFDNYYSFRGATSLTSVDLSNCTKLSYIGEAIFQDCYGITSVTFPSSLTTIYRYAFYYCKSLNSITWNSWNSSASVESTAFSYSLPSQGTVLVTNPIGSNNSAALLAYLKTKGLPNGWTVA